MTLTIVATAGSASANSFLTEAEQITYMAARLNASSWTTVSGATCTETEKAAMIEAQRELNVLGYIGTRATEEQTLQWPRQWATDPDSPNGWYFDSDEIPQRIKDAQAELAFQFLKSGTTDVAALPSTDGIIEKTIDVLTTRYSEHAQAKGLSRFPRVMNYVRPLLANSGGGVPVVRG